MSRTSLLDAIFVILVLGAVITVATALARNIGQSLRTGKILVRCRDGHIFRSTWIPFASLQTIRGGPVRYQYCPVGEHWAFVTPVDRLGGR